MLKLKIRKKIMAAVLLAVFCIVSPGAVFATEIDEYHEVFQYEENGKLYECVLTGTAGTLTGEIYKINGETKEYDSKFVVYENDIETQMTDDGVMPMEVYPVTYHSGTVKFNQNGWTIAKIATEILAMVRGINPITSLAASTFLDVAQIIHEDNLPIVYYLLAQQLETFPTDVPSGYYGAVTKIDYDYNFYSLTEKTPENLIGGPYHDVYYGMP